MDGDQLTAMPSAMYPAENSPLSTKQRLQLLDGFSQGIAKVLHAGLRAFGPPKRGEGDCSRSVCE